MRREHKLKKEGLQSLHSRGRGKTGTEDAQDMTQHASLLLCSSFLGRRTSRNRDKGAGVRKITDECSSLVAQTLRSPLHNLGALAHDSDEIHDIHSLVGLSLDALIEVQVLNGSWIVIRNTDNGTARLAKAVLIDNAHELCTDMKSEDDSKNEHQQHLSLRLSRRDATQRHSIFLSPILMFNIGAEPGKTFIEVRTALSEDIGEQPGAAEEEHQNGDSWPSMLSRPLVNRKVSAATEAAVARVLTPPSTSWGIFDGAKNNSSSLQNHQAIADGHAENHSIAALHDSASYSQEVANYFSVPRILSEGDIIAIPISADFDGNVETSSLSEESNSQNGHSSTSESPSKDMKDSHTDYQPLYHPPKPFRLLYFRVSRLSKHSLDYGKPEQRVFDKAPVGLVVNRNETTLIQFGSVHSRIPDADQVSAFYASHIIGDFNDTSKNSTKEASLLEPDDDGKSYRSFPSNADITKAITDLFVPSIHNEASFLRVPVSALLIGPTGSGRSSALRAATHALGLHLLELLYTDIIGPTEGHTAEKLKRVFNEAMGSGPCVLYIRRINTKESQDDEIELRMSSILQQCVLLGSRRHKNFHPVFLVGSANQADDVAPALRACFTHEFVLETPSESERLKLLQHFTINVKLAKEVSLSKLAQKTAGKTASELSSLVADAGVKAINRFSDTLLEKSVGDIFPLAKAPTKPNADGRNRDISEDLEDVLLSMDDLEFALAHLKTPATLALGAPKIPNVKWDDVGGLADVKKEILDVVQLPLLHPEMFASGLRQRSGILLYGPPGTGKTLLAKAVATECSLNFISVKGPELLNMYIGESEKNVREVFQSARNARPCVLFFDELDSLAPARGRGSDSGGVMDRVVSQLLTELDGVQRGGDVFVIGATNRPDLLEPALLRPGRFDRLLYLGICSDADAQLKIISALTRKFNLADDVDLTEVARWCPITFTGADFYALCSTAMANAIRKKVDELEEHIAKVNSEDCYSSAPLTARGLLETMSDKDLRISVSRADFEKAMKSCRPSVSSEEIQHYEKLRDQYSSQFAKGQKS